MTAYEAESKLDQRAEPRVTRVFAARKPWRRQKPFSLEHSGSIFLLAVVVVFVRGRDAEQDSDNERDNDENCPREE